jgi:hypothetical protein
LKISCGLSIGGFFEYALHGRAPNDVSRHRSTDAVFAGGGDVVSGAGERG